MTDWSRFPALVKAREPIAVVILVAVSVNLVISAVSSVRSAHVTSLASALGATGGSGLGLASLLAIVVSVGICAIVEPSTEHVALLARMGAVITAVGALVALVNLVAGFFVAGADVGGTVLAAVGGSVDVIFKVLAGLVLWQLAQRTGPEAVALVADRETVAQAAPEMPTQLAPTWGTEQATGVAWPTAKAAASAVSQKSAAAVAPVVPATDELGPAATADPGLWSVHRSQPPPS